MKYFWISIFCLLSITAFSQTNLSEMKTELEKMKIEIDNVKKKMNESNASSSSSSGDSYYSPNTNSKKSKFSHKGHIQVRNESAKNRQGIQGVSQNNQTFLRFRPYFTFSPSNKVYFNLTPQATKVLGADNAAGTSTSGSTTSTELFFFEANLDYHLTEKFSLKLGRQELNYGDQLIIGSLAWANTGRSFDGLKAKYKYDWGWTDIFYSKITDNNNTLLSNDDTDLLSIYNSWGYGDLFKNIDLYYIHLNNKIITGTRVNTLGFRLKGGKDWFFYRTENGYQSGSNLGSNAYQYNLELGGKYKWAKLSAEYAVAGPDYRQKFPTAHKFQGFADVIGRRNIENAILSLKTWPMDWFGLRVDYHMFRRHKTDTSAFKLDGSTAWGVNGTSDDIGSELDIIVNIKTKDSVNLQLGAAFFSPGEYMKQQDTNLSDDTTRFLYAMVNANF